MRRRRKLEDAQSEGFCSLCEAASLVFPEDARDWDSWDRGLMVVKVQSGHHAEHVRDVTGLGEGTCEPQRTRRGWNWDGAVRPISTALQLSLQRLAAGAGEAEVGSSWEWRFR